MNDIYKTVNRLSTGEFKDRGSKFLSFVYPINNEDDVKNILTEIKKKYHDARHHCYAFSLGADKDYYRVNDDGEPSGTAGKPIYNQILSYDLTNVLIIVVRYFGGTLLGTGGLINAYRNAAADSLRNAEVIEKTVNDTLDLIFDYTDINDVHRLVDIYECRIVDQTFQENCHFRLQVRKSRTKELTEALSGFKNIKFNMHIN